MEGVNKKSATSVQELVICISGVMSSELGAFSSIGCNSELLLRKESADCIARTPGGPRSTTPGIPWPQLHQEAPDLSPIPARHVHLCTRDQQSAGHSPSGRDRRAPCVFLPVPRSPQAGLAEITRNWNDRVLLFLWDMLFEYSSLVSHVYRERWRDRAKEKSRKERTKEIVIIKKRQHNAGKPERKKDKKKESTTDRQKALNNKRQNHDHQKATRNERHTGRDQEHHEARRAERQKDRKKQPTSQQQQQFCN